MAKSDGPFGPSSREGSRPALRRQAQPVPACWGGGAPWLPLWPSLTYMA